MKMIRRFSHRACFGGRGTPEYETWGRMIQRCHNPKHTSFQLYGARGIEVCEEWRKSFEAFLSYIGPKPGKAFSIDRIDNDRGYEPGNVRWATQKQQNRNLRSNKLITINDTTLCISEWAERIGIKPQAMKKRLKHPNRDFTRPKLDPKPSCKNGHPFIEGSFKMLGNTRLCIQCRKDVCRRYYEQKKQAILRVQS